MPINLGASKFNRINNILASLFLLLPLQAVSSVRVLESENFRSINETRHFANATSEGSSTGGVGSTRSSKSHNFYANHRMDSSHSPATELSNLTLHQNDEDSTSDTILRPQLALQIFTTTNSAPPTSEQHDGPKGSHIDLQGSGPGGGGGGGGSGTMFILPIRPQAATAGEQSANTRQRQNQGSNHRHAATINHHHHNQRGSLLQPESSHLRLVQGSSMGGEITTTMSKVSPWHYVTDQSGASNQIQDSFSSSHDDGSSGEGGASIVAAQRSTSGPMINAIITVPSSTTTTTNEHFHQHHHLPASSSSSSSSSNPSALHQPADIAIDDIVGAHVQANDSLAPSTTSSNLVEQTISRLLDSQAAGNIELSMNLDGDEIIVNPINKQRRSVNHNSSKESSSLSSDQIATDNDRNENLSSLPPPPPPRRYSTRRSKDSNVVARQSVSKALGKHIASELVDDQQSASEIDLIDGNSNGNNNGADELDSDSDEFERSNMIASRDVADDDDESPPAAGLSPKLKDVESDIERDEQTSGGAGGGGGGGSRRFWGAGALSESHANDKDATSEQAADESHLEGRHSAGTGGHPRGDRGSSSSGLHHDQEGGYGRRGAGSSGGGGGQKQQQQHTASRQPSKAAVGRRHNDGSSKHHHHQTAGATTVGNRRPASTRKTSSSKRRSTYQADDRESSAESPPVDSNREQLSSVKRAQGERVDTPDAVSSVTIKGEDVKRFELLLENLRSLSLNSLATAKAKRTNKSTRSSQQQQAAGQKSGSTIGQSNDDDYNRRDQEESTPASHNANSKSWNQGGGDSRSMGQQQSRSQSSSNRLTAQSEARTNHNNNDCDRRKQLHKSASGDGDSDSDSSANIVDQDPMTSSNDNADDLNDESGPNGEQEEQSSDNHNKISLPNSDAAESDLGQDQPPASYSSDSLIKVQPRSLYVRKTILQSYFDDNSKQPQRSQNEAQQSAGDNVESAQEPIITTTTTVGQRHDPVSQHRAAEDLSPINNYIDYNKLDDREMYKGSESRKFRVLAPPREQIDRMRSLQEMLERAAMQGKSITT